jgi:hypothetical protein
VVDFASKRAERERRAQGGPGAEPAIALAPDQEVNSGPDDSIAAGAETVRSTAALEEDLDNVLNQALGIQGEGKTSQASAGGGGSGLGSAGTADAAAHDAFSLGAREELNADKLFESVPRANPADLVNRESTKFFVAAAGVDAKKKKNKMGFAIGGGAAAAVALFIVAWAAGYIQINIPGIGNPFASNRQAENELPMADELTPEQIEEIRRGLATRREIEERRRARREGTGGGTARSKRAQAEPSGYVTDGADEREEGGRRGDEVASVGIDGQLGAGAGPVGGLPDAVLPGADLSGIEPVTSGRLDQNVIRQVVNERKSSVSICYQRELKGNSNLRGKMEFLVTVEASGIVSQAGVQSPAFKGTALASCIADKIKGWRFPPFEGAAQQIVVPFVLE